MPSAFLCVSIYSTLWNQDLQFSSCQSVKVSCCFNMVQRVEHLGLETLKNTHKKKQKKRKITFGGNKLIYLKLLQKAVIAPGSIFLCRNSG